MKVKSLIYATAVMAQFVCGTVTAQVLAAPPVFEAGDKWTFEFTNKGDLKKPYTITHQAYKVDAESGALYGESQDPSAKRKQYVLRFDYKRADTVEGFEYQPTAPMEPGLRYSEYLKADSAVQFPMAVGNKYDVKWPYPNGAGYFEMEAKVEGYEKLTVAAGTFDAYRIKYSGWWYNQKNGQTTAHGRAAQTRWYAPAAKRFVKWDTADRRADGGPFNETILELIKWEPQAALPAQFVR